MSNRELRAAWLRRLEGETSPAQEQALLARIQSDESFAREMQTDQLMDDALGTVYSDLDQDDFMDQFERRLLFKDSPAPSIDPTPTFAPELEGPVVGSIEGAVKIDRSVQVDRAVKRDQTTFAGRGMVAGAATYFAITACLVIAAIIVANRAGESDSTGDSKQVATDQGDKDGKDKGRGKSKSGELKSDLIIDDDGERPDRTKVANESKDLIPDPSKNPFKVVNGPEPEDKVVGAQKQGPEEKKNSTDSSVAEIVSTKNAVWEGRRPGQRVDAGPLYLVSGQANVRLRSGTNLTIEGPAELELRGTNDMVLHRGSLSAIVPAQAIGFGVATPTTQIVDLGTEFTVDVDEKGATDVAVTKGKVELSLPKAKKTTKWELTQGDRKWVDEKGTTAVDWRASFEVQPKDLKGTLIVNGKSSQFEGVNGFSNALGALSAELLKVRQLIARKPGFIGNLTFGDKEFTFDSVTSLSRTIRVIQKQGIELLKNRVINQGVRASGARVQPRGAVPGAEARSATGGFMNGIQGEVQQMIDDAFQRFPFGGGGR